MSQPDRSDGRPSTSAAFRPAAPSPLLTTDTRRRRRSLRPLRRSRLRARGRRHRGQALRRLHRRGRHVRPAAHLAGAKPPPPARAPAPLPPHTHATPLLPFPRTRTRMHPARERDFLRARTQHVVARLIVSALCQQHSCSP
eukprot:1407634-Pleurochrysis_carterae.AAC.1